MTSVGSWIFSENGHLQLGLAAIVGFLLGGPAGSGLNKGAAETILTDANRRQAGASTS